MKIYMLLLLFLFVCFNTFGQAGKLIRQAKRTDSNTEKIKLYNQAIELEPNNLDAYFFRGLAKNDIGEFHSAITDYSKIILIKPDADTYFNRGNARFSLNDFTGAKNDYAKAYELDNSFLEALFSMACANYDLGNYSETITNCSQFIKTDPHQPRVYNLRAMAYNTLKKYQSAIADYNTAVIILPDAESYYNRGVFLLNINYYKNAQSDLTKSIQLGNKTGFAFFYRGTCNVLVSDYKNAINDYKTTLNFDALDFDALLGLAMAYLKSNDTKNAKLYYNKAVNIISPTKRVTGINDFKHTYWYEHQYYFFNKNITALSKL
ncbi:MAG: tetratricopeptide repeat protein [Aestuariibaculum sp.]